MTNEEKSYEILKAIVKNNQSLEYYKQQGPYEAAMQMAEWKDEQFSGCIRKDALLEWAQEKLADITKSLEAQDAPVLWGQRNAFQQTIDKINSL